VGGAGVDDPPGAVAVQVRLGVVAAGEGRFSLWKNQVVVTAPTDPDARARKDEVGAATWTIQTP
jgi:hypothetical protein